MPAPLQDFARINPFMITINAMRALWLGLPAGNYVWGRWRGRSGSRSCSRRWRCRGTASTRGRERRDGGHRRAPAAGRRPPAHGAGLGLGYMPGRLTPLAQSAAAWLRHHVRLRGLEPDEGGEQGSELAESLHAALEETVRGFIV
jgi:hypothetical protein